MKTGERAPADDSANGEDDGVFDLSPGALWAHWNALRGDPYELDAVERFIENAGPRLECSDEGMVQYAGTAVRYHVPVKVSPPFQERLARFEELLSEVATEFYGRPPRRIRHLGAFSCRLSRNRSQRLSEHALGNAIDVVGFDFGPASKEAPLAPELPRQLRGPFQVRVSRHWNASGQLVSGRRASRGLPDGVAAVHGRFLRQFTERLVDRSDIFRIAIGPSHRGHHDHFHFDVSPWRYVDL